MVEVLVKFIDTVLHQLDQKIIYPHYDFKHLAEKYFEIGMKLDDFLIQLVKYCKLLKSANRSVILKSGQTWQMCLFC